MPLSALPSRPGLRVWSRMAVLVALLGAAGGHAAWAADAPATRRAKPKAVATTTAAEGPISFYAQRFHGRRTANGERMDNGELTMAHPDLPFGTQVRVTNLQNQRTTVLRVNDRGPFAGRRVADVSRAAAELLGFVQRGVTTARLEVVSVVGTAGAVAGAAAQAAADAASATVSGVGHALGALESQMLPATERARPAAGAVERSAD